MMYEDAPPSVEEPVEKAPDQVFQSPDQPQQEVASGPPTFALWREDGSVEIVHPDGYDPAKLTPLPEDFDEFTSVADPSTQSFVVDLSRAKAELWAKAKQKREQVRYGGCTTPLGRIDTDPESQRKINGAVTMAIIAADQFQVHWTMQDNTVMPHNAQDMITAGMLAGRHDSTCHAIGQWLRGAIFAATTCEQLDAIDINAAPWPA
jgi:hypothetical protein